MANEVSFTAFGGPGGMTVDYRTLPIHPKKWGRQQRVSRHELANVSFNLIEEIEGTLIARLTADVMTASDTVVYPANWWEAVWERWAPKWAQERWPVRYTTVDVELLFPGLAKAGYGPIVLKVKKGT